MQSRRTWFRRLAQAAAIVALAPQLAFKAPKLVTGLDWGVGDIRQVPISSLPPEQLRRLFGQWHSTDPDPKIDPKFLHKMELVYMRPHRGLIDFCIRHG